MEENSRKYVRTVLTIHLALLALVIAVVTFAATRVHTSVREQSIMQAQSTQELLARQVAAGVQSYYESITRVLALLTPVHAQVAEQLPADQPAPPADGPLAELRADMANRLWAQLKDRVSMIAVIDPLTFTVTQSYGDDPKLSGADLIDAARPLIRPASVPVLGPFTRFGGLGGHMIYVPLASPQPRGLLTFVPMQRVESTVLADLNRQRSSEVMLLDAGGQIISDADRRFVGLSAFTDFRDARLSRLAADYMAGGAIGTEVFKDPIQRDEKTLKPAMLTLAPVKVLDQSWSLVVSSNLALVDEVVDRVFQEALLWAVFVIVSMSAILVSTAIQLIRVRVRLEKMQRELIEKELNQARRIQLAWLPKASAKPDGVEIAALNRPANHISGDFYNWFDVEGGRIVIVIGDVTGHGMSAAFLMATTQLLVKSTMQRLADPAAAMTEINRQLSAQVFASQFVTMVILLIDREAGTVQAVSAGHPPPLVGSGARFVPMAMDSQLVLGIESSIEYAAETFELPPGAAIVLYTDGAMEVSDAKENQLGEAGLIEALGSPRGSPQEMIDSMGSAVDRHRAGLPLLDDLTLVAIKLEPAAVTAAPAA